MEPTAECFVRDLRDHRSDEELRKIQSYFKSGPGEYGHGDVFMGVRMGDVFELAKQCGTSCTSWRAPTASGRVARRSTAPVSSSGTASWTTPSRSPRSCSATRRT